MRYACLAVAIAGMVSLAGCGRVDYRLAGDAGASDARSDGEDAGGVIVDADSADGQPPGGDGGVDAGPGRSISFLAPPLAAELVFRRASTATYLDATGAIVTAAIDEPRFDHDAAGAAIGLSIEGARTNLLAASATMTGAPWSQLQGTWAPDGTLAPDGTMAMRFTEDTTPDVYHAVQSIFAVPLGVVYTFSGFAMAAGRNVSLVIRAADGTYHQCDYDLVGAGDFGCSAALTGTLQPLARGWYRLSATMNVRTGATTPSFYYQLLHPTIGARYEGDGASGVYIWGAQLEAGSSVSSYIPTPPGATATRAADHLDFVDPSFVDPAQYTFVVEAQPASGPAGLLWSRRAAGGDSVSLAIGAGAGPELSVVAGGTTVAQSTLAAPLASGAIVRSAVAVRADDFAWAVDGTLIVEDPTGAMPAPPDAISLGRSAEAVYLDGHLRAFRYEPFRLDGASLAAASAR
jgi:hypothetical protein